MIMQGLKYICQSWKGTFLSKVLVTRQSVDSVKVRRQSFVLGVLVGREVLVLVLVIVCTR